MIYGIDYLGGAMYAKTVLQNHPKGFAAGFFAREFGDVFPLVQKLAATGQAPVIRIQLNWDKSHRYTSAHLRQALKDARRYDSIKGASHIQLSLFCEHTDRNPDPKLDLLQAAAPSCTIVNNPQEGKGAFSHKYLNEVHTGPLPFGPGNFSYDGKSSFEANVKSDLQRYHAATVFFLWDYPLNCHKDKFDKTRNARPTGDTFKRLARLVK